MVSYSLFQRKNLKWWKKMFFSLFMVPEGCDKFSNIEVRIKSTQKNYFKNIFYVEFGLTND